MILGMHLGNDHGALPHAWRMPGTDPRAYTSFDAKVRQAQTAERGKFQFLFLPDGPSAVSVDLDHEPSGFNLDVMMTLAAVARETERIGLVATGSTTFNGLQSRPAVQGTGYHEPWADGLERHSALGCNESTSL
ncbi:LLM class flavin-dependent oxidoreductase [Falsirhodobacter deserti]|uniref:LLM class flavin-dependent oxidoreductase n=1 Tax=Falsirhodobacter deserti TaxID=1365611 RepID=UPI0019D4D68F|nr:LLM class flavin-dependent oxidoreductase [Falsirhodobacter deserti]